MKNFKIFLVLMLIIPGIYSYANNLLPQWEIFTDQKNVVSVAVSTDNRVYCASTGGLYVIDGNNGNILNTFSNIHGLISNEINTVIIDNQNRLWVGASDGSISIYNINTGTWKYIYDIKNSSENNKSINAFFVYGNYIFVATGYGIHKISLNNFTFVDAPYYQLGTLTTKSNVTGLTILNDSIYATTSVGIAYANLINSNLNNPASWTAYTDSPLGTNVFCVENFDGKVFAGSASGFAYRVNGNWTLYPNSSLNVQRTKFIRKIGNKLYFISNSNANYGKVYFATADNLANPVEYIIGNYNTIGGDKNNNPVVGEYENGVNIIINNINKSIFPNCPNRNFFTSVTIDNSGNIWGCPSLGDGGFFMYNGSQWTNYINSTYPIGTSNNFKKVRQSPDNNYWAMSFGGGILKFKDNNFKVYKPSNSNLPGIPTDTNFCVPVEGIIDNNGIFWTSFYLQNSGASLYAYNGDDSLWIPFYNPSFFASNSAFINMAVDNYNTKWICVGVNQKGLYYFNENGTLTNPSDDIYGFYNLNDFNVNDINDVIVERNGEVWIATDNGVFIINDPLGAITHPGTKPTPQKLGIISGNLKVPFTENCRCITNDVLNDKWIGTESNGIFHLSADGSTLIEQFNILNSPVVINRINSITVSKVNGKAYFGTDKGLFSYQTSAIQPVTDFDKITCMPNPYVLPSGVKLKIDGLVEGSTVKIITLSGEVIKEFDSPGGRIASWDGTDKKGNLVPSGIYIVVAFNKDASKVGKGKVAIIRKN
jgi:sugar lactone lactonase YvrE